MLKQKVNNLEKIINNAGEMIIAFSGGVDSTYLLFKAIEVLGRENVLAVTAKSDIIPEDEFNRAQNIAKKLNARHIIIEKNELSDSVFTSNPTNRCYHCKKGLLDNLKEIGEKENIAYIAEGSNYSDSSDFRPGMKAVEELKCFSPLKDAFLTKDEIRNLSKEAKLETWDQPASPCLATRIPYGESITGDNISSVAKSEKYFHKIGLEHVRVRHEGSTARIEVLTQDFDKVLENKDSISKELQKFGYLYVSLDLNGYVQGNLNKEVI